MSADTTDWRDRLVIEKNELGAKISKLNDFTKSDIFMELKKIDSVLLLIQLDMMKAYYGILVLRLHNLITPTTPTIPSNQP